MVCFQVLALVMCASADASAQARVNLAVEGSTGLPPRPGGNLVSVWSGGACLMIDHGRSAAPVFTAVDRDGRQVLLHTFTIPGAYQIDMFSGRFAHGFDGSLAVAGLAFTRDSRGSPFIGWVSPDGRQQVLIRMPRFSPYAVALASDGTMWVAGREFDEDAQGVDPNHSIIRRYDRTGKLLGALVPWSSLPIAAEVFHPKWHPANGSFLAASRDRVGWYSIPAGRYMEFSLDGRVITDVQTIKQRLLARRELE